MVQVSGLVIDPNDTALSLCEAVLPASDGGSIRLGHGLTGTLTQGEGEIDQDTTSTGDIDQLDQTDFFTNTTFFDNGGPAGLGPMQDKGGLVQIMAFEWGRRVGQVRWPSALGRGREMRQDL